MSISFGCRWRPAAYRSTTEAIIVNRSPGDPEADPPVPASSGQRVQTLQGIVFDDVNFASNPYRPGDPQTEQYLAIIIETPIMLEVSAFAGLTIPQSTALWDAARDAQWAAWQAEPDIMSLVNAAAGGALSTYVVL